MLEKSAPPFHLLSKDFNMLQVLSKILLMLKPKLKGTGIIH